VAFAFVFAIVLVLSVALHPAAVNIAARPKILKTFFLTYRSPSSNSSVRLPLKLATNVPARALLTTAFERPNRLIASTPPKKAYAKEA
jgi:hypothetical protein